ncbi:MAG: nucleotidyltransferase family protein [Ardenticatenia bacterium]|nr:nucleotidyltransferase family protein [Ardenticatenia bacterium]MBK8538900.1 nucleotidyltransferase family protein [Ardenticatenia bacterium]
MIAQLHVPQRQLAEFCRRHYIRKLALFGSVLRPDFSSDSDVDVWVEFEVGHTPGLAFFSMEAELSEILGRQVDLNTPAWLGDQLRERVARQLAVLYDAA